MQEKNISKGTRSQRSSSQHNATPGTSCNADLRRPPPLCHPNFNDTPHACSDPCDQQQLTGIPSELVNSRQSLRLTDATKQELPLHSLEGQIGSVNRLSKDNVTGGNNNSACTTIIFGNPRPTSAYKKCHD
jgi:hypothetical protein